MLSNVTLVGHHSHKMAAAEWHGTEVVQDPHESLYGADIVVEATGSADGLRQAVRMCRPRGNHCSQIDREQG